MSFLSVNNKGQVNALDPNVSAANAQASAANQATFGSNPGYQFTLGNTGTTANSVYQNSINTGIHAGMLQGIGGGMLGGYRVQEPTIDSLTAEMEQMKRDLLLKEHALESLRMRTPVQGPTPQEIKDYPALASIMDELRAMMKLVGIKR